MTKTEEVICGTCGGSGHVDRGGTNDICPDCFGLGVINIEKVPRKLSSSKRSLRRVIIVALASLMVYYGIFFYIFSTTMVSISFEIIFLLAGHFVVFGGLIFYLLFTRVYMSTS
ncbi:MAG TPA: hypothetical protein VKU79_05640 [Thermoplasmataceae archaeon]|nr:hypothetical protein [Thermoplasmatales archaeon AK]HLH86327.1 hypothetical protein [Thermoplasmataceae archaeon]